MDAVGLSSAHLVGWSDGAVVGLLVALHRPSLVRRLVLIGQNMNPQGMVPEFAEMTKLDRMPEEALPPTLREMYAAVSPDGPDHWAVVVDKMWRMLRTEPDIDLNELNKVSAPTLIIAADHDIVTIEHAAAMQRALPDSQLAVVPGAQLRLRQRARAEAGLAVAHAERPPRVQKDGAALRTSARRTGTASRLGSEGRRSTTEACGRRRSRRGCRIPSRRSRVCCPRRHRLRSTSRCP